jgi:CRP-like cAMP-binding protein
VFLEDATCDSIGVVIEGQIDIVSYSFSGKEINYNSLQNGDIFGNNLLFSDSPKYKGNVISKGNSLIAFIKKELQMRTAPAEDLPPAVEAIKNAVDGEIVSGEKSADGFDIF